MDVFIKGHSSLSPIRKFLTEWTHRFVNERPEHNWPTFEVFTQALAEGQDTDVHELRRKLCADLKVNYEDIKNRRVNWTLENAGDFDGGNLIKEFTIEFTPLKQTDKEYLPIEVRKDD